MEIIYLCVCVYARTHTQIPDAIVLHTEVSTFRYKTDAHTQNTDAYIMKLGPVNTHMEMETDMHNCNNFI